MENLNIERAKEKDLSAIWALQKASFSIVAKKMNNFDIPPLVQTLDEITKEYQQGVILKCVSDDNQIIGSVRGGCGRKWCLPHWETHRSSRLSE